MYKRLNLIACTYKAKSDYKKHTTNKSGQVSSLITAKNRSTRNSIENVINIDSDEEYNAVDNRYR